MNTNDHGNSGNEDPEKITAVLTIEDPKNPAISAKCGDIHLPSDIKSPVAPVRGFLRPRLISKRYLDSGDL